MNNGLTELVRALSLIYKLKYITPDQIGDSQPVLQDEISLTFSGSTRFAKIMDIRTLKGGQEYLFRLRIVF